jgi:hypothetical protein
MNPLFASIYSNHGEQLIIENSLQPKQTSGTADYEEGLDNLVKNTNY